VAGCPGDATSQSVPRRRVCASRVHVRTVKHALRTYLPVESVSNVRYWCRQVEARRVIASVALSAEVQLCAGRESGTEAQRSSRCCEAEGVQSVMRVYASAACLLPAFFATGECRCQNEVAICSFEVYSDGAATGGRRVEA